MATKAELLTFAEAHGIAADESMLKADIETAIYDAGYDPNALEGESMGDEKPETQHDEFEEQAEMIATTSSDSLHATYAEVEPDAEISPPPGRQVEESRGVPTEHSATPAQ